MDTQFRMACRQAGEEWLAAETMRMRLVACEGRRAFDKDLLHEELARHLDEETCAGVMAGAYKNGRPYDRLVVSGIS